MDPKNTDRMGKGFLGLAMAAASVAVKKYGPKVAETAKKYGPQVVESSKKIFKILISRL